MASALAATGSDWRLSAGPPLFHSRASPVRIPSPDQDATVFPNPFDSLVASIYLVEVACFRVHSSAGVAAFRFRLGSAALSM
jgi:hypothetical protein